ncbi:sucrose-6-phosphate hydrolase [Streptococcus catagoni]|uniref:sucrose-6-phosphate hydrolase n=1 Tax=Streptococcus catagoni TaxID=2654874 RepID=UPI0014076652|nr:sucrose-6-phosphate hydrolase [Streptococcus catagoni]
MDLPRHIRYQPYHEWTKEDLKAIKTKVAASPWHCHYHVEPASGLLNDPNGFSYFQGQYHLFYQNWPFGPAHGLKQWVHMTSTDLVHFKETPTRLLPDHQHDSHGAYSGSAYPLDDRLFLFYTGNVRDNKWRREALQVGAYMDQAGQIVKCDKVLIQQAEDVTEHFRDPQIFDYQGQIYAIIGAQNLAKKGIIKLYKAINRNVENWQFVADLDFDNPQTAYMIECPNLVFIDHKPVLIYCPQGLSKDQLAYDNIYPNTYQVFDAFDPENGRLVGGGQLQLLDSGFEAYATQAFNDPKGQALAVSWLGLPDIDYPSDVYDYQGALSLVKHLTLKDDQLYQYPVKASQSLRQSQEIFQDKAETSNTYELELQIPANNFTKLSLFANPKEKTGLQITINTKDGQLTMDRSQVGVQYATDYGTSRSCQIPSQGVTLNIYVDQSIVEIFVNKGQSVLSSRVFPKKKESGISLLSGQADGHYYQLRK